MAQPEADYEIDLDDNDKSALRELRADQAARRQQERKAIEDDHDLSVVQMRAAEADGAELAVTEGVIADDGRTVELLGRRFRVAEKIGIMPLLKYASAADMDTDDPRALGAVYMMLRDCIYQGTPGCGTCQDCKNGSEARCKAYDKGDWAAFEEHAISTKADAEELVPVISQAMEIITARPTRPRDGSSAGQRATRRNSTASTSGGRGRGSRR